MGTAATADLRKVRRFKGTPIDFVLAIIVSMLISHARSAEQDRISLLLNSPSSVL
jgi:hypothetical protein